MTDIIILAVVAIVLGIKLFSMFGQKRGMDKKDFDSRQSGACYAGPCAPAKPRIKEVEMKLEKITDPMTKLKVLYPSFDKKKFLKESKNAYKRILNLYAEGNTHDLSDLLNIEMMRKFAYAITQREEKELKCNVSILKIKDPIIEDVVFEHNTAALLRVAFDSEVIHYTSDKKNNVKTGHKTKVDNRQDIWTFRRDISSTLSSWKLVAVNDLF